MYNLVMNITEKKMPKDFHNSRTMLCKKYDNESDAMDFVKNALDSIVMHPADISSDAIKKIIYPDTDNYNDDNNYIIEHVGNTNDYKWASIGYCNKDRTCHWTVTLTVSENMRNINHIDNIDVIVDSGIKSPAKNSNKDGFSIYAPTYIAIPAKGRAVVECGVSFNIPYEFIGKVSSSSDQMINGVMADGTLHHDKNASTKRLTVSLFNVTDRTIIFEKDDEIANLYIYKVISPDMVNII